MSYMQIEQYGYSDATIDHIQKIFSRLETAEVILTFAVDSLIDYLSEKSLVALMNLGFSQEDSEYIIDRRKDDDCSRKKIQYILYENITKRAGAPFYTPFFIKSDACSRSYWLFHFSCHPRAKNEMTQLHWEKQNTFLHYGKAGLDMLVGYDSNSRNQLYGFDNFAKERSKEALAEELPRLIYNQEYNGVSFQQLQVAIINSTPASRDMIKESLENSMLSGEIIAKSKKGAIRRNASAIQDDDIISCHTRKQGRWIL